MGSFKENLGVSYVRHPIFDTLPGLVMQYYWHFLFSAILSFLAALPVKILVAWK